MFLGALWIWPVCHGLSPTAFSVVCHCQALRFGSSHLTSLSLSFHVCKVGTVQSISVTWVFFIWILRGTGMHGKQKWMQWSDNHFWMIIYEMGSHWNVPFEACNANEMQKCKMAVWGGLTYSCEKKRSKKQRRKGKIEASECRVPKKSKERQESLPQWSVQRNRGKQQNGKD